MADRVVETLQSLASRYPLALRDEQLRDVERTAFHIGLVASAAPLGSLVCDVGGGIGLFSVGCAALGYSVTLVDDFRDSVNERHGDSALALHRSLGIRVISCDAIAEPPPLAPLSFHAITSFDSMEHWHHSPKRLFRIVVEALVPGGAFVVGTPNCVNLRKRITVPLGWGKWSQMQDWYEHEVFRGHVREPDLDDYQYIARDLGLRDLSLLGRNWLGRTSPRRWIRLATALSDPLLRLFPSLCADIYMIARK